MEINKNKGVSLLWNEFMGSGLFSLFRYLIAGDAGLIKIKDAGSILHIATKLSNLAMVGIFSISKDYETSFEEYMFKNKTKSNPEEFVKNDSSYFSLILDGDNYETESGLLCIISYGKNCPKELIVLGQ